MLVYHTLLYALEKNDKQEAPIAPAVAGGGGGGARGGASEVGGCGAVLLLGSASRYY